MENQEVRQSRCKDKGQFKMNMIIVYTKYVTKLEWNGMDENSNVEVWRITKEELSFT